MPALREEEVHRIRQRLEERRKSQVELRSRESATETDSRRAFQDTASDIGDIGDVSYRVYQLADLDARRASLASTPAAPVLAQGSLERIGRAAADSMNVAVAWTKGDRSSGFVQTLRPSLTTLMASMRLVDGRLLARRAVIVVVSLMFLVGAVLLLAEVTDDVRPAQARAPTSAVANLTVTTTTTATAGSAGTTTPPSALPPALPRPKASKKKEVEIFLP